MPKGINSPPTRREQIAAVYVGTKRDSKILASQNLDLKSIRQPHEKINRSRVKFEWANCERIIKYLEPFK